MNEKRRVASIINTFFVKSLSPDEPQVAEFERADIENAIVTERFVFVLSIYILPNLVEDGYENYDETASDINGRNWFNNIEAVGKIG